MSRYWLSRAVAGAGAALLLLSLSAPGTAAAPTAAEPLVPGDADCVADSACVALFDRIGESAKRTMGRAIVHAMLNADTVGDVVSYCDSFPGACGGSGRGGYPNGNGRTGRSNNITDVPGIRVGSFTAPSTIGTTVLLNPPGTTAGVEVRGSAPGGRGTDATRSEMAVQPTDAVVLTGGSAFGLAAADGVVRFLEEQGKGAAVGAGGTVMPVVPTSVIFDLGRFGRPFDEHATPEFGYRAAKTATSGSLAQGNVGGGAGAQAGGLKGGLGFASEDLGNGVVVGAVVDINSVGAPMDPGAGCAFHSARYQIGNEFGGLRPPPNGCGDYSSIFTAASARAGKNTTIGVVATNLALSRPLLSKLAQYGQDGLALGIRPSHAYFDGDTVWSLSTNDIDGRASLDRPAAGAPPPVSQRRPPVGKGVLPATGAGVALGAAGVLALVAGLVLSWRLRIA